MRYGTVYPYSDLIRGREMEQPIDSSASALAAVGKPRLLAQVRDVFRQMHYSYRTEKTYLYWIRHFIRWSGRRHPRDMGAREVTAFLSFLANERSVTAAMQNQAVAQPAVSM